MLTQQNSPGKMSKSSESLLNQLPKELITEILIRIPSKSVCRMKLVSKHYNSLISDPDFIPLYVSRACSPRCWLILDRLPQIVLESTHATQFQLVDRPKISTSTINPIKLRLRDVTDPDRFRYPTSIIQSSNGLILFGFSFIREQALDMNILEEDLWRFVEEALYVVDPIRNEWIPLPESEPIKGIRNRKTVGFTTRVDPKTGVVGRFMVVDYRPEEESTLVCFVSDRIEWVELSANYMLGSHKWMGEEAFELDGKLFWVDFGVGLITWDVKDNDYFRQVESKEKGVCRFIPLPPGLEKEVSTLELGFERWIGVGGGFVQFMDLCKEGQYVLKVWRLNSFEVGGKWSLMYQVSRDSVQRFLIAAADVGLPKPCFFHPFEADVAYFRTTDYFFAFNFRSLQLGDVQLFPAHELVVPFVLPRWPSPIPNHIYAAFMNVRGYGLYINDNFNEAIKCYSKVIDLSPSSETFAHRAWAYLRVHKYQEAENDCTETLKLDANHFGVYRCRALARRKLGNFKGALEDAEVGLKLKPENENIKKLRDSLKCKFDKGCKVSSAGHESCPEGADGA